MKKTSLSLLLQGLRSRCKNFNHVDKIVDDTCHLVGSSRISTAREEFVNISDWAKINNIHLNPSTIKEMIIANKGRAGPLIPQIMPGAERISSIKILGAAIPRDLKKGSHLDVVLIASSSSLYAPRVLRSHGFP